MSVHYTVFLENITSRISGPFGRMLFLASLAVLTAFGCGKHEAAHSDTDQRSIDVTVVTVTPQDVPVAFEYVAQAKSSRQVNIQARVNGFLDKRVYTEGSIVREGQTLFVMDQKPFKVQLEQAKAALAKQEAAFHVASQNLARVKPLAAANALSQKDLDDATGQFQSASAAVEQAKASVEQAKLNLSYTVITSPVTGMTSYAQQADGTYLSPSNSQLTTVAVLSPIYVNFSISENEHLEFYNQVTKGLLREPAGKDYTAEIILADGSVYPIIGKVTFADSSFNAQTGTFMLRATVENPNNLLRPNQYLRVRLKGAIRPNAILVPQRAVQQSPKGHFVWVVGKDDKAEPRPVVVGEWHGNDWFIFEGLHQADRVVVDGALTVRPGAPLKATPAGEQSQPAGAGPAAPSDGGK